MRIVADSIYEYIKAENIPKNKGNNEYFFLNWELAIHVVLAPKAPFTRLAFSYCWKTLPWNCSMKRLKRAFFSG